MKLPVTQKIVEDVLTEAHRGKRLFRGRWASHDEDGHFYGCAVGNLLNEASGRKHEGFRDSLRLCSAARDVADEFGGGESSRSIGDAVSEGNHLGAISVIFEKKYRNTDASLDAVLSGIRKHLPARFSIDIDGLRALPTWRKKRKATKRKAKAVRK